MYWPRIDKEALRSELEAGSVNDRIECRLDWIEAVAVSQGRSLRPLITAARVQCNLPHLAIHIDTQGTMLANEVGPALLRVADGAQHEGGRHH